MIARNTVLVLGTGACLAIALSSQAESVLQPGITTFRVTPRSCQDVTFGQHAFEQQAARVESDARFAGVLLGADVQEVLTRDVVGLRMANPPAWRTSNRLMFFVLEGAAKEFCPRLKQEPLELQVVTRYCDTRPARGTCLIPQMPLVRLLTPESAPLSRP